MLLRKGRLYENMTKTLPDLKLNSTRIGVKLPEYSIKWGAQNFFSVHTVLPV